MNDCLMKSDEHTDRLLAYCAGRLDAAASENLQRHMDTCPPCAAVRGSQSAVWSALNAWETPPVSADFNRRLYARIEEADALPWYRQWLDRASEMLSPVFAQPAFPLAAAAVVVVTGFLLDHPAKMVSVPANQATIQRAVSPTDAEQVEKTLDELEMLHQFDVSSEDKEKTSKSM